jgi:hypothetical protein
MNKTHCFLLNLAFYLFLPFSVSHAHDDPSHDATLQKIASFAAQHRVSIEERGEYIHITSNGLPKHETGDFPNRGNPHTIQAQSYNYRVPANPIKTERITQMQRQPFGIALNGVLFDPGTAECYGKKRGERPDINCKWHGEAIKQGRGLLGLDENNAHVQPNGAYHYHGIPQGYVNQNMKVTLRAELMHIGYAADGFKIYTDPQKLHRTSYRLKSGRRPANTGNKGGEPNGYHDGTYTEDYEFISKKGTLDECNGAIIEGDYGYVVTDSFPYIPRCWKGTPDQSFKSRARRSGEGTPRPNDHTRPLHHQGRPPHHRF